MKNNFPMSLLSPTDSLLLYCCCFFLKETSLLGVVDKLLRVCSAENTEVTTVQTALYSLKLLCRRIGPNHPQMFIKVGVHSISFLKEKILFKNFYSRFSFCIHVHYLMCVLPPQKTGILYTKNCCIPWILAIAFVELVIIHINSIVIFLSIFIYK